PVRSIVSPPPRIRGNVVPRTVRPSVLVDAFRGDGVLPVERLQTSRIMSGRTLPILAVCDVEEHELRSDVLLKIATADHGDGGWHCQEAVDAGHRRVPGFDHRQEVLIGVAD